MRAIRDSFTCRLDQREVRVLVEDRVTRSTTETIESQLIDGEFLFTTWLTRLMPLTILVAFVSFIFMRFAFRPEMDRVEGTREYFSSELRAMGRMNAPEKWGLFLFVAATLLAFTRQLYAEYLPGLTPALSASAGNSSFT